MIALQQEKHVTTVTNKTTSHDAVNRGRLQRIHSANAILLQNSINEDHR